MKSSKYLLMFLIFFTMIILSSCEKMQVGWKVAEGPLFTTWAKNVTPENVLPEYPRPQLTREDWMNLNGLWEYTILEKDSDKPQEYDGNILVPFPVESALSGVKKNVGEENELWYRALIFRIRLR